MRSVKDIEITTTKKETTKVGGQFEITIDNVCLIIILPFQCSRIQNDRHFTVMKISRIDLCKIDDRDGVKADEVFKVVCIFS